MSFVMLAASVAGDLAVQPAMAALVVPDMSALLHCVWRLSLAVALVVLPAVADRAAGGVLVHLARAHQLSRSKACRCAGGRRCWRIASSGRRSATAWSSGSASGRSRRSSAPWRQSGSWRLPPRRASLTMACPDPAGDAAASGARRGAPVLLRQPRPQARPAHRHHQPRAVHPALRHPDRPCAHGQFRLSHRRKRARSGREPARPPFSQ